MDADFEYVHLEEQFLGQKRALMSRVLFSLSEILTCSAPSPASFMLHLFETTNASPFSSAAKEQNISLTLYPLRGHFRPIFRIDGAKE